MGKWTDEALRMQPYFQKGIQTLDDADALAIKTAYFEWDDLLDENHKYHTVSKGFKFRHKGRLYKTKQPEYTFVKIYEPGAQGTESLFEVVDETHAGTIDNPIPYNGNMALEAGKYYEQHGVVYLCFRDTINPVYAELSALVDMYVKEVE